MKKNLLIYIPSIEDGGVEKNLYIISKYLSKKNINISLLTCNFNKMHFFNKSISYLGPKHNFFNERSRMIKNFICMIILFFYLLFSNKKYLVFAFQSSITAIIISKIFANKVVTRSNSSPVSFSNNLFYTALYSLIIKFADEVIVNSYEFSKLFFKKFKRKTITIYNPFIPKTVKKLSKIKIKKSFFKNNLNIISVGRLTDQKNHITQLKAIKYIDKKYNPNLTIIGKGYNEKYLKSYIENNNINKKVQLIGYKKNPFPYIVKSDILILSSKFEGLPNILLEAQYLKKYIISSNCSSGPKEILMNGKAGDLFKVNDYKALAKKINYYCKNKFRLKKKILFGFNNLNRFDYNKNCKKYYEVLNNFF
tara:strand:+ start:462 stop:1556 length:1095 start_codon:yes stop_codon:yes gene_type:complete